MFKAHSKVTHIKQQKCIHHLKGRVSHTRTVVQECCKGDNASQCRSPKFDPPSAILDFKNLQFLSHGLCRHAVLLPSAKFR